MQCALLVCLAAMCSHPSSGAVTPELQRAVRQATFEVVLKKPTSDSLKYEKPLPLEDTGARVLELGGVVRGT